MEASGSQPAAQPPPPPPPPSGTAASDDRKASGGMRALAVLLALVLAFGAAVMFVVAINPDDTPRCEQIASGEVAALECYDITETQQTIQNVLAIPAGVLGALAALVALAFAATGRYGGLLRRLAIPAIVLGIAVFIVGQI